MTGTAESKLVNALIVDTTARVPAMEHRFAVTSVLAAAKRAMGGLWVGGRVTVDAAHVTFEPNKLNSSVHTGTLSVRCRLSEVTSVEVHSGLVTNIVEVRTASQVLKFRCHGAGQFAERIRERQRLAQ